MKRQNFSDKSDKQIVAASQLFTDNIQKGKSEFSWKNLPPHSYQTVKVINHSAGLRHFANIEEWIE